MILNLESNDVAGYGPEGYKPATSQKCVGEKSQRNQLGRKSQKEGKRTAKEINSATRSSTMPDEGKHRTYADMVGSEGE